MLHRGCFEVQSNVKAGRAGGVVTIVQDDFIRKGVEFYHFGVAECESRKLVLQLCKGAVSGIVDRFSRNETTRKWTVRKSSA